MPYWLLKTEPGEYSYHDLEHQGRDMWDGVKNPSAQKNIRSMSPGDRVFIYHTGKEKAVIGVAEVVSPPYPDPANGKLHLVDVAPKYRLKSPVTLAKIKADPAFSAWELVRLPRLSVMPVPQEHWARVHTMAGQ